MEYTASTSSAGNPVMSKNVTSFTSPPLDDETVKDVLNTAMHYCTKLLRKNGLMSDKEVPESECGCSVVMAQEIYTRVVDMLGERNFHEDYDLVGPGEVDEMHGYEEIDLIEELMLMANILTAQRLATLFPKHAFLRRHCKPKMKLLNNLAQELTHYGIHLDTSAAGALNASLKRYGPIDPEDQGISPIDHCDILDNIVSSNIAEAGTEKTSSDFQMIPKLLIGSNDQRCQVQAKENHSRKKSSDITKIQQETCMEEEICTESLTTVVNLEESMNNLIVWDGMIEYKVERQSEEQGINAANCVHLCSAGEIKPMFERESVNSEEVENNKKTLFENVLPSPMKNSPSEKELTVARGLVLNHLCAKPMVRADYYCLGASVENTLNKNIRWKLLKDDIGDDIRDDVGDEDVKVDTHHYALNIPLYTHFTSPIRRYADIMVHRLLAASLGYAPPPQSDPLELQKIAMNCNKQNTGAKRASEASNELFFRLWVRLQVERDSSRERGVVFPILDSVQYADPEESRSDGGLRETAVVVNAKDYSFEAILLRFGILVRVYVNKLPANVRSNKRLGTNTISIRWFLPGKNAATRESPVQDITMFSLVDLLIYYSYSARRVRAELLSPFNNLDASS